MNEEEILPTDGTLDGQAVEQDVATAEEHIAEQETATAEDGQTADAALQDAQDRPEQAEDGQATAVSRPQDVRTAVLYFIFAGAALACVYLAQIFRLCAPLFERIYYGNLTNMLISICQAIFWVPCIVVLYFLIKKCTGYKVFRRSKTELSLKRSLIIYACAVVPIFIVSAALKFELKIVYELGKRVTGVQLGTNAVMYANGAVKLVLAIIMVELVQEGAELLYKGKYAKEIPWGGIALALVFGFLEVIVAYATHTNTMFAWLYVAFDLLYGFIYTLSKKNFYITFFVSLIIYIL